MHPNAELAGPSISLSVTRTPLRLQAIGPESAESFRLRVSGACGTGPLIIGSSTNLLNWTAVSTNAPAVGTIEVLAPSRQSEAVQYYRASEPSAPE